MRTRAASTSGMLAHAAVHVATSTQTAFPQSASPLNRACIDLVDFEGGGSAAHVHVVDRGDSAASPGVAFAQKTVASRIVELS